MNDIQLTLDSSLYELEEDLLEKDGIIIQFVTLEGKTEILDRIEPVDASLERELDDAIIDFEGAIEYLWHNLKSRRLLSPDEYCRYFLSKEKVRLPKDTIAKIVVGNSEYFIFAFEREDLYYISTDGFVFFTLSDFRDFCKRLAVIMFDKNRNLIHFGEDIQFSEGIESLLRELANEKIIEATDGQNDVEFDYGFVLESKKNFTVVNFSCLCLAQLIFSLKTDKDVINAVLEIQKCLVDGRIEIIDSVPEHILKTKDKSKVPVGYVQNSYSRDNEYHRAGTVLIRDNETQICYLLGQDEDQYFGCELPSQDVNTVEEAFLDLMPEAFRDYAPSSYKRQGEWFVLNIESEKPKNNKVEPEFEKFLKLNISVLGDNLGDEESCSISHTREGWTEVGFKKLRTGLFVVDCEKFDLENRDPDNIGSHFVSSYEPFVCAFSRSIIRKDNYYLIKFFQIDNDDETLSLHHIESEHEEIPLKCNTCYAICENRAVQSVSMGGVD